MTARKENGIIIVLLLASFLTYANTFENDFAYDDMARIVTNEWIRDWSHLPDIITHSSRPLRNITFMTDYSRSQLDPVGWHITNILLHAIATVLVFYLARLLLARGSTRGSPDVIESSVLWIAGGAALLFATHPVHTEAVTGISNRQESLMTIFLIGAMLAWEQRSKAWLWYPLSLVFIVLALASKQTAFIAPLMLILQDLWRRERFGGRYLLRYLPFVLVGFCLIWFLDRLTDVNLGVFGDYGFLQRMYIMSWAFLKYLAILLWPSDLSTHVFVPIREQVDFTVLLCWGLLVLAGIFIWRQHRRRHVLGFLTAAYLVSWIPYSNILPYTWVVAERYLYFPSVFFCIAASWLLFFIIGRIPVRISARQRPVVFVLILVTVAVAYGVTALDRNRDWRDEETLMTSAIRTNPTAFDPHYRLGMLLAKEGRLQEALFHYRDALRIVPSSAEAANNLGLTYMHLGRYEEAKSLYQQILAKRPKHLTAIYNMACLYSLQDSPSETMHWLRRLAELADLSKFPIRDDPDLESFRASAYYDTLSRMTPE